MEQKNKQKNIHIIKTISQYKYNNHFIYTWFSLVGFNDIFNTFMLYKHTFNVSPFDCQICITTIVNDTKKKYNLKVQNVTKTNV